MKTFFRPLLKWILPENLYFKIYPPFDLAKLRQALQDTYGHYMNDEVFKNNSFLERITKK